MMDQIKTEKKPWGYELTLNPLMGDNAHITVMAQVTRRPNRGPEIRFSFNAVLPSNPIPVTELTAWIESLRALREKAEELAANIRRSNRKKK
jgi:hypothetical protein